MVIITILLFLIAALMGIFLISYVIRNKNTPKGIAIIHGSIAAIGILFLIALLFVKGSNLFLSLLFFILAALGGFIMMYRDIGGKSVPKWLAVGHGLIALIGFALLLIAFYH